MTGMERHKYKGLRDLPARERIKTIRFEKQTGQSHRVPKGGVAVDKEKIIKILRDNRPLLARHHVRTLSVFGSVVRGEAEPGSDIDVLVEFEPDAAVGLFEFMRLKRELSELLGMEVDLGTPDALHPALRDDILREAVHVA
jgi:hypothetical protein